jgi:hypothetical protein
VLERFAKEMGQYIRDRLNAPSFADMVCPVIEEPKPVRRIRVQFNMHADWDKAEIWDKAVKPFDPLERKK